MSKIWKVTFDNTFDSYSEMKLFYTEKEMMKILTKLYVTSGTIEIFESDDQKLSIDNYLESIKREVQLTSLLEVADEKSLHHSKFIEILSNSGQTFKYIEPYFICTFRGKFFYGNKSASRSTIESDMNTYYSVY